VRNVGWLRSLVTTCLGADLHVDAFGAVELMFELEESFGLSPR
jgi:acyl carrier protein